ncbi:MAG: hypothetical protein K1X75_13140 [Leptospirales bacterium]|nr:hypothetical protein [Leptospirales bacterium]
MSWKIGVYELEHEPQTVRDAIQKIYSEHQPAAVRKESYSFQHDYDPLPDKDIQEILGAAAKHNSPIGLYANFEAFLVNPGQKRGEYLLFSVPILLKQITSLFPQFVGTFSTVPDPVRQLDSKSISAKGIRYEKARLIASVVEIAHAPIGDDCIVRIFW